MPTVAPYGTWKSPIGADLIVAKSINLVEVLVDPITGDLYHSEGRPSEGGRNVIVKTTTGEEVFDSKWNARTGVHEYGGAAALVYNKTIYFSDWSSKRIHRIDESGPVPVSPENSNYRYADFAIGKQDPTLIVAVLEDHTKPKPKDVVNTLVVVDTKTQAVSSLVTGADFYAAPRFSPDGSKLAWLEWVHPDMPWEGSVLKYGTVSHKEGSYTLSDIVFVAGKAGEISIAQPFWASNTTLLFLSDENSGYYNPWKFELSSSSSPTPILKTPLAEDFAEPAWILGMSRWSLLDSNTVIASSTKNGMATLLIIDIVSGKTKSLVDQPYATISSLFATSSTSAVFVGSKLDDSPELVEVTSFSAPSFKSLKTTSDLASTLPPGVLSKSEGHALNDGNIHVLLSLPTNGEYVGPDTEKPPVVVNIHGGPTARVTPGLSWITQYFTSRGWAWLDVNYSGSSGYGRAYRERLRGQWGVADVQDSVQAVELLSHVIDSKRAFIRGGSAGGYTVLQAVSYTPPISTAFAAGTSSYGISDLKILTEDTHKFESNYLFKLVGGTPSEIPDIYNERSPIKNADRIKVPLLILQGSVDAVVPPNQAQAIVDSIRARGGEVEYKIFEGEGHGWRKSENIKIALETERAFYEKVLNLNV